MEGVVMNISRLDTFVSISRMARAISTIADIDNRDLRAGAYIAAGVDPADIALFDPHAVVAERARRTAFSHKTTEICDASR